MAYDGDRFQYVKNVQIDLSKMEQTNRKERHQEQKSLNKKQRLGIEGRNARINTVKAIPKQ